MLPRASKVAKNGKTMEITIDKYVVESEPVANTKWNVYWTYEIKNGKTAGTEAKRYIAYGCTFSRALEIVLDKLSDSEECLSLSEYVDTYQKTFNLLYADVMKKLKTLEKKANLIQKNENANS